MMKIEYYLPATVFTNQDLEKIFPKLPAAIVEEKIGIRERHISAQNETALDLAIEASKMVLEGFDKDRIDFILLCTQSPDYFLPSGSCILQDKLGLITGAGALDFNLGCSGYIYGLTLAKGLLQSRIATNVLLVTAETYSKYVHPRDRANRAIFGDGAAATIIQLSDLEKIHGFELGTDGSGYGNLIVTNGALRQPYNETVKETLDENGNLYSPNHLYMNGQEIFNFTIEKVPGLIEKILKKNNFTIEEIDYFIFHQANKYMLEYLRKKIRIPSEKFHNNTLLSGNTVSSTIPIALKESMNLNIIKPGDKVLLAGFGVGYSWGATILEI